MQIKLRLILSITEGQHLFPCQKALKYENITERWQIVANHVTPSWVEGFARSTWCLSYFRASRGPHSRDASEPIPGWKLILVGMTSDYLIHVPWLLGWHAFTGSLSDFHGWCQRTVCIQAGVTFLFRCFFLLEIDLKFDTKGVVALQ